MELISWIIIFIISLAVLVKGADWLLDGAEKIGLSVGLSPFVIGAVIIGLGTSFPELVSSVFGVLSGVYEIPVANAVGSNIANILLFIGFSAIVAREIIVKKDLILLDIPLLVIATSVFWIVSKDGSVSFAESILLLITFIIYFLYTIFHKANPEDSTEEDLTDHKFHFKYLAMTVVGLTVLILGAKYLIDSVVAVSDILGVGAGVISLVAVAVGTSLPELIVSVKAALSGKPEIAVGNIFGSNVFNLLMVVGVSGLFHNLTIDLQTLDIAIPIMILSTIIFSISVMSKKIYIYEGAIFIVIYALFIGSLFNIF